MNTRQALTAAVISLIGSAALAQSEVELQHVGTDQKSTVSRVEVRAKARAALVAGELTTPSEVLAWAGSSQKLVPLNMSDKPVAKPAVAANKASASPLTREDVRAQARQHMRSESAKPHISTGY